MPDLFLKKIKGQFVWAALLFLANIRHRFAAKFPELTPLFHFIFSPKEIFHLK